MVQMGSGLLGMAGKQASSLMIVLIFFATNSFWAVHKEIIVNPSFPVSNVYSKVVSVILSAPGMLYRYSVAV